MFNDQEAENDFTGFKKALIDSVDNLADSVDKFHQTVAYKH